MQALNSLIMALCSHAWYVLTFRHRGEGLDTLSAHSRVALLFLAGLLIGICTYFAPGQERGTTAVMAVVHFAIFSALLGSGAGGGQRQAMFAILTGITEPAGLVFRWTPGLQFMDLVLSWWVVWCISLGHREARTQADERDRLPRVVSHSANLVRPSAKSVAPPFAGCRTAPAAVTPAAANNPSAFLPIANQRA